MSAPDTIESGMIDRADTVVFAFDPDNRALADRIVARYPDGRQASAVLPLLDLAQRQNGGWLPQAAIEFVAGYLAMPNIRVHEVATFYSMFNLRPVGKYFVQICRTTPCWLRGSDEIVAACERFAGCRLGETSADGAFTLVEVECLGACCNAPMVQINDDYYEDLTPQTTEDLLNSLKHGKIVKPGSQAARRGSEPIGGRTTLLDTTPAAAPAEDAEPIDAETAQADEPEGASASATGMVPATIDAPVADKAPAAVEPEDKRPAVAEEPAEPERTAAAPEERQETPAAIEDKRGDKASGGERGA